MKRLIGIVAGIALTAMLATTLKEGEPYVLLRNLTAQPQETAPAGNAMLFVQNGVAKQLVGSNVTTIGSGAGGGGEWSTIWPPTNIQNPTIGMKAVNPTPMAGYLPADTVYSAAERVPPGVWRYFTLSKRPFL